MRALLATLAAPLLIACAPPLHAGSLVDVQIVDRDGGGDLTLYRARGKQYVAGVPGHRYSVRLTNHSSQRVMTVLSVDGVNAITGQTASPAQSGYVLAPYESTEISGWRKDMSSVAAFEFTALSDSYAARTGRPDNVGVIGVAVYRERVSPPVWRRAPDIASSESKAEPRQDAAAAPPAAAAPGRAAETARAKSGVLADSEGLRKEDSLGTGHGERESSSATYTSFERDSTQPYEIVSIWYDSLANLQARGVVPRPRPAEPQAFPGGFVADPPSR
jgi:hypothetical protein